MHVGIFICQRASRCDHPTVVQHNTATATVMATASSQVWHYQLDTFTVVPVASLAPKYETEVVTDYS